MPSASASCSWLIPSILRRIRNRLPTCWSVGLGPSFAAMVSEPPWLTARQSYEQKILPTLGHSTSRFNEQFLDEVVRQSFLRSQAASTGGLREYRFLDNDLHFFGQLFVDSCFGIKIRASRER